MSAFLDETGTLITVDHSNPLPVALVAGFTSLNDGELKTASYANPLPVTVVTTNYTEEELPDADSVAVGTEIFNTTYQVKMRSNGTSWEWLGIGKSTWATKPSAAQLGQIICITDIGENGILCRSNGTSWIKLSGFKYYQSVTPFILTGTTSETVMATFTLKGGILGANGCMKIWPVFTKGTGTTNRTVKVNLNGNQCFGSVFATTTSFNALVFVRNQNSESSQKTSGNFAVGGLGGGTSNLNTTENTANDVIVTITGTLANAAEPLTLDGFFVEVV